MKLKKNISKLLFCSILLNNIYFYSNAASNSSLSRYETLEGEMITLEDVEADDISEIEIFGNTVQDSNNLEDIQSVGDLYVNNEGEPILDDLGREQYKIDILSNIGINFNKGKKCANSLTEIFSLTNDATRCITDLLDTDKYRNSTIYVPKSMRIAFISVDKNNRLVEYTSWKDINKGFNQINMKNDSFKFAIQVANIDNSVMSDNDIKDIVILSEKQYKTTILLPCQLMKVGDVADRLYWDNEKSRYIIEKNIATDGYIDKIDIINNGGYPQVNTQRFRFHIDNSKTMKIRGIFALSPNIQFVETKDWKKDIPSIQFEEYQTNIRLWRTVANTIAEANDYFSKNPIYYYYVAQNPQLIETNITKKIKLTTYPEKTYISTVSESSVRPTLKITIDKIEEVSGEAVDNAVSTPTSNNIALARMFVNMLPESLYKDELQAKLNEIFSEDMVLDKQSATANLDVYIKSENILMMSLDTNTVTFEDYSGVEELELQNAINISINSSLPYQLNAYIVGDIANKDKDKTLDLDVLNIRDSSQTEYKNFDSINNKLVLLDNIEKGNNISHNIDLKLSGDKAYNADIYKTTIKFEAEQK